MFPTTNEDAGVKIPQDALDLAAALQARAIREPAGGNIFATVAPAEFFEIWAALPPEQVKVEMEKLRAEGLYDGPADDVPAFLAFVGARTPGNLFASQEVLNNYRRDHEGAPGDGSNNYSLPL